MAGRPRLPQEVAQITGSAARSAGRFAGRSSPKVRSLGPAPKRFSPEQAEIWDEFNDDFPWLGRSDRNLVGLAVLLQMQINLAGTEATAAMFGQMRLMLSSMGGTPVDRSKVGKPDDEDEDPAAEFIQ